jgi:hypothetical protein
MSRNDSRIFQAIIPWAETFLWWTAEVCRRIRVAYGEVLAHGAVIC